MGLKREKNQSLVGEQRRKKKRKKKNSNVHTIFLSP
jgi:hypothetical protein